MKPLEVHCENFAKSKNMTTNVNIQVSNIVHHKNEFFYAFLKYFYLKTYQMDKNGNISGMVLISATLQGVTIMLCSVCPDFTAIIFVQYEMHQYNLNMSLQRGIYLAIVTTISNNRNKG